MKNKIDKSSYFVALQGNYSGLSLALFNDRILIAIRYYPETKASSYLIPYLDELLAEHRLTLQGLSFIAIDRGPGAFTSLRVMLATVNGIALTGKCPVIGVSGLDALSEEMKRQEPAIVDHQALILLNAYNNDCYYLFAPFINKISKENVYSGEILNNNNKMSKKKIGCLSLEDLLAEIKKALIPGKKLFCSGNALSLHKKTIQEQLGSLTELCFLTNELASAESIGRLAYEQKKEGLLQEEWQVEPLYLKTQLFAVKK